MTAREPSERGNAASALRPYTKAELDLMDLVWGASVDDVYIYDAEGRYRYVNSSALSHLGLEREQMLGRTWQEVGLPEESTAKFEALRREVLETGESRSSDTVYPTTDGDRFFEYTVSPLFGSGGTTVGTLSVVRDTTEARAIGVALEESELRYRTLFMNMAQGVVYQNRDFEITVANEAAYRILGLTRDSVTGRTSMDPIWHAIHEDGTEFPGREHASVVAMQTRAPVFDVSMGIKTPSMSDYHWLRISAIPLFHPGESEPFQVVSIFEDVTAHRLARSELERRVAERTADLDAARMRVEDELLQRSIAESEMMRTNRLLRMLSSCNQVLVHARDGRDLLEQVTRALADAGGYAVVAVLRQGPHGYQVEAHSVTENSGAFRVWLGMPGPSSRLDEVVPLGRPDVWRGAFGVTADPSESCTVVTVPMHADEILDGALLVVLGPQLSLEAEEIGLLVEMAGDLEYGLVALRVRKLQYSAEERMLESYKRVENAMRNSIAAMARMAETRDPYTAGHQERVADLAYALARAMNYTEERAQVVWLAASVHDIGKISVPAEILSKPGSLTPLEFTLVQRHPEAAYDILKEIELPWPIAEIVLQHHERMDGSGYPRGLSGDELSEEVRILMVADVVEAVSSHRPYRESLGVARALEILREGRGTAFDATVVDTCLGLFEGGAFGFSRPGSTTVEAL